MKAITTTIAIMLLAAIVRATAGFDSGAAAPVAPALLSETGADYAHCRTQEVGFPKGQDVEAMTAAAKPYAEKNQIPVTWDVRTSPSR